MDRGSSSAWLGVAGLSLVVLCGLLAPTSSATPYWIAWEGDDFPENQGWTRYWGDWEGEYHGDGAIRTLESGILTYDSLADDGIYDFSRMSLPGQVDPDPGETFVMEWGLTVAQVDGRADPTVGVFADTSWAIGFEFAGDHIESVFEEYAQIPFAPGVFHAYRLESSDMHTYKLYIDSVLVRTGAFVEVFTSSEIAWGDGVKGAASSHEWDYFRFGCVPEPPEPCALVMLALVGVCGGHGLGRR